MFFHFLESITSLVSEPLVSLCSKPDLISLCLVGNPKDRFSHNQAQKMCDLFQILVQNSSIPNKKSNWLMGNVHAVPMVTT